MVNLISDEPCFQDLGNEKAIQTDNSGAIKRPLADDPRKRIDTEDPRQLSPLLPEKEVVLEIKTDERNKHLGKDLVIKGQLEPQNRAYENTK